MNISGLFSGPVLLWLIFIIAFAVGEIATVGLTSIWFAVGSLFALIAAMMGMPFGLQIAIFLFVSILMLLATRPWVKKYVNSKVVKTNVDEHIGKVIVILENVNNLKQTGMAVVNGQEWTVRSADDQVEIMAGHKAVVKEISGVKLIVEELKEE